MQLENNPIPPAEVVPYKAPSALGLALHIGAGGHASGLGKFLDPSNQPAAVN